VRDRIGQRKANVGHDLAETEAAGTRWSTLLRKSHDVMEACFTLSAGVVYIQYMLIDDRRKAKARINATVWMKTTNVSFGEITARDDLLTPARYKWYTYRLAINVALGISTCCSLADLTIQAHIVNAQPPAPPVKHVYPLPPTCPIIKQSLSVTVLMDQINAYQLTLT
jgi:hypothetical protein